MDIRKLQRAIVDGLEDVKAQDIVVFNTEALSPLFERVIIASGTSNRQTKALAASVRDTVKARGLQVLRTEGEENGEWIIVDCGAAVAHIMQPSISDYYHLEEIWGGKPVHLKRAETASRGLPKASEEPPAPAPTARKTAAGKPAAKKAAAKKAPAKKAPAKKAAAAKPGFRAAAPDLGRARAPARKTPRAGGTATPAAPRPPARKTAAAAPAARKAVAPKAATPKAATRKAAAPRPAPAKTAAASPRKVAPRPAVKKSAAAAPRAPRRRA